MTLNVVHMHTQPDPDAMRAEDWARILDVLNHYQHNAAFMDTRKRLMKHLLKDGDQA